MVSNFKKSNNNDNNTRNNLTRGTNNYKYLSRCHYYGTLKDIEYISDAMVLVFKCYIATEYYGGNTNIRVYVPTELEDKLQQSLITGNEYFIVAAPYRITFKQKYQHRVDLLINIFESII